MIDCAAVTINQEGSTTTTYGAHVGWSAQIMPLEINDIVTISRSDKLVTASIDQYLTGIVENCGYLSWQWSGGHHKNTQLITVKE